MQERVWVLRDVIDESVEDVGVVGQRGLAGEDLRVLQELVYRRHIFFPYYKQNSNHNPLLHHKKSPDPLSKPNRISNNASNFGKLIRREYILAHLEFHQVRIFRFVLSLRLPAQLFECGREGWDPVVAACLGAWGLFLLFEGER